MPGLCWSGSSLERLDGAMRHAFALPRVAERLAQVNEELSQQHDFELLIWDAYRTQETQRAIFSHYLGELGALHPEIGDEAARERASRFVFPPEGVFPHGTGGRWTSPLSAVTTSWMGTGFDEFSDRSAAGWFQRHPPRTRRERTASRNRELLRTVMEAQGSLPMKGVVALRARYDDVGAEDRSTGHCHHRAGGPASRVDRDLAGQEPLSRLACF
jgi:D-ala-D-ala dipeptidase